MNIALTEREQQLLSSFATKQYEGAKDNVGTKTPIHVVERIRKQYIESNEGNAWLWSDGYDYTEYFDSFDDMLEHERQFSGRDLPQYSEVEYEEVLAFADEEGNFLDFYKGDYDETGYNPYTGCYDFDC